MAFGDKFHHLTPLTGDLLGAFGDRIRPQLDNLIWICEKLTDVWLMMRLASRLMGGGILSPIPSLVLLVLFLAQASQIMRRGQMTVLGRRSGCVEITVQNSQAFASESTPRRRERVSPLLPGRDPPNTALNGKFCFRGEFAHPNPPRQPLTLIAPLGKP